MPSSFQSFEDGDLIEAEFVSELQSPIQNLERGAAFYAGTSDGSSTAYAVTLEPAPDDPYQAGMLVNFKVHIENEAGSPDVTLDVNEVGPKPILKNGGQSLLGGDLQEGQMVSVILDPDGSQSFKLVGLSPRSSMRAGTASYANSADEVVLNLSGRRGWLHFADSTDSKCRAYVTPTTVTIEAASADWVASSTPASGEVGLYVDSGELRMVLGSSAARTIGFLDQLMQF